MQGVGPIRFRTGRGVRQVLGQILGACIVGYFAYHAIQGHRGLLALNHLQREIAEAEATLAAVRAERERLEHRAQHLRPDSLDLDMLDERARVMLNFSHPDDVVIFLRRDSLSPPPHNRNGPLSR